MGIFEIAERVIIDGEKNVRDVLRRNFFGGVLGAVAGTVRRRRSFRRGRVSQGRRRRFDSTFRRRFREICFIRSRPFATKGAGLVAFSFVRFARLI